MKGAKLYNKFNTMTFVGRFLWNSRTIKIYHDGDCIGFVWNWINPLSWLFAAIIVPLSVIFTVLMEGLKGVDKHFWAAVGVTMNPFFTRNPDKLRWITREEYRLSNQ